MLLFKWLSRLIYRMLHARDRGLHYTREQKAREENT
jgi:hypothetical protein